MADALAARLLRRHIFHCAEQHARLRALQSHRLFIQTGRAARNQARQPEVEHFHVTVVAQHEVVGFDVAMRDAGGVRHTERLGHLSAQLRQRFNRAAFADQRPQRAPLDEFHHDEATGFSFADFVNGDDVGMIERGGGARFLLEAPHAISIGSELFGQQLERDLATEPRVFGQIDLAHPARAELLCDAVV